MDWNNKNVVITGAAGFIGSHLADVLVGAGANVTAVDLISQFGSRNIDHLKGRIKVVDADITNEKELDKIDGDTDFVFHLAAYAVPGMCDKNPDIAFKVNVQGTFNMMRFAVKKDVQKFVFRHRPSFTEDIHNICRLTKSTR